MKHFGTLAACAVLAACGGDPEFRGSEDGEGAFAQGVLGGYERGRIWGWAQVTGDAEPVNVRIEVDGQVVAVVLADEPRGDLLRKGVHATGRAGFSVDIDDLGPGAEVDAFIDGHDQPLTNGPCLVQGDVGVSSCTEGMSRGVLGGYANGRVWGWAHVIGREEPTYVRIEVDGEPVATVLADRPREDLLEKRLHPSGRAGFEVEIGEVDADAEIAVIVDEDDYRLITGTHEASPRPALITR